VAGSLPARPAIDLLRGALDSSPELQASQREIEHRLAQVGVERSRQYPDITLSAGAKRDNSSERGTYPVLGVSLPLPLFDRNQGNLYSALRQADKAADLHAATRLRLTRELQQASNRLQVSRGTAQTLHETVLPAAQQAWQAASRGFEAGKFGYLDVLDAQRTLLQARLRYLDAASAAWQAATTIDRILGR
jgi:cobalt-zinc-cadmium efflux system outer membrane protein